MESDFQVRSLAEVAEIISGGTPKTSVPEYWNGTIPWLSVTDFNTGYRWVCRAEKSITELGLHNSATRILSKGDIILSARGTVGAIAQVASDMAFNQSCYGIRGQKGLADTDYLYYAISNSIEALLRLSYGAVFNTITRQTFNVLKVPIPPLKTQKSIAVILGSLDDKIELNRQINEKLEGIAQALFKSWFVYFDPVRAKAEGRDTGLPEHISSLFPTSFVDSELGQIPEGWSVKRIGDLDLYVSDYVANGSFASLKENVRLYDDRKEYALFIRNTDLKLDFSSTRKYVDRHSYEFLKKSMLFGGEVIISNVGDVGSVFLCPFYKEPMTLGNNVIMLKSTANKEENAYYYRYFLSDAGQAAIASITGGSVQMKFNKTDFRNLPTIYPPKEVMKVAASILSGVEKKIWAVKSCSETVRTLRDSLLPKLISGELPIPDAERIVGRYL